LKYNRDIALGEALARHLIELLVDLKWEIDLVIPVPVSRKRQVERGYNQAAILARPVALYFGWQYQPRVLKKIRETSTQVGLSVVERRKNVAQAFQADPKIVRDQTVLIIDDVATSGATLDECATALSRAGSRRIYGLTLARATLSEPM
jgi:ComF family protein